MEIFFLGIGLRLTGSMADKQFGGKNGWATEHKKVFSRCKEVKRKEWKKNKKTRQKKEERKMKREKKGDRC